MCLHRNWLLNGSGWIAFSVVCKFNDEEFKNLTFDHPDGTKIPIWCNCSLVTWSKDDKGYEAMRQVHERAHEMIGTSKLV